MNDLKWGILGTGNVAKKFAKDLPSAAGQKLVAVGSRSKEAADVFGAEYHVPPSSCYDSYDGVIADPNVQCVYISLPNHLHKEWAIQCAQAKKHILCEKPLATNVRDAHAILDAVKSNDVFMMEAFMYRCHPLIPALIARVKAGEIGEIRHLRADFGFRAQRDPKGRLFDLELGGGGILDVGGYPVSFARLIAGVIVDKPFAEPTRLHAVGFKGPTGADEITTAVLSFESGLSAALTCAVHHRVGTEVVLYGEVGQIVIPDPWIPKGSRQGLESSFVVKREGQSDETVSVSTDRATYAIQAELLASSLPALEAPWPAMGWQDSLGNMRVLDAWRKSLDAS